MPTKKELVASNMTVEEIGKWLGVDSIGYLSIDAMLSMHSLPKENFCVACFSGKYPTKIDNKNGKLLSARNGKAADTPRAEFVKRTRKAKVTA